MATDIVVFLGPTLSVMEARAHLDALYLPPVGQGDVVRVVRLHAPSAIVIIDGVFAQRPAVRHKELLWAMAQGVAVHGAASMGALRAAELAEYGMTGHGLIYRWYRRTPLADDADVAVAMAPPELGSRAFSEALVDIRVMLKAAERDGVICRETRLRLEAIARSLHFSERQFQRVIKDAEDWSNIQKMQELSNLSEFLTAPVTRQKAKDAIYILDYLNRERPLRKNTRSREFTVTENWLFDLKISGCDDLIDFPKQRDA